MIRGLGNYLGGRPGLEDWWCKTNRGQDKRRSLTLTAINGDRAAVAPQKQTKAQAPHPGLQQSATEQTAIRPPLKAGTYGQTSRSSGTRDSTRPYEGLLSSEVVSTFCRAASIVRDALDVDGALFVDASVSSFGGLVDSPTWRPSSPNLEHHHWPQQARGQGTGTDRSTSAAPQVSDDNGHTRISVDADCGILALSTSGNNDLGDTQSSNTISLTPAASSSHNGDETPYHMRQRLLSVLLERYPQGRIWCFEEDEDLEPAESPATFAESATLKSFFQPGVCRTGVRSRERYALRRLFPGVRSLAFVGLWDNIKNRWFSGSVIWTCNPVRVFASENELSYLSAFGDTMMAEVARINVKMADKAKSDFISTISHELRSPLHGILGSVECLQETAVDESQADLLLTVKACGETLLDTVDHLLDHAKIETLAKDGNGTFQAAPLIEGVASLESDVDLSLLVEQAIETVYAGHAFVSSNTSINDQERTLGNDSHEPRKPFHRPVSIGLSLSKHPDSPLIFRTSAGAWRRIILNLVGNGLKFTQKGHVNIALDTTPAVPTDGIPTSRVVFTVTDTGKGISEDFLQNQLFEPFAQEDFLMPGTGLGLSMCRQIVASLGGTIEVQSKRDTGTIVRVTAFLVASSLADEASNALTDDLTSALSLEKYQNSRLNFFGVDPEDRNHPLYKVITSLQRTCKEWFGFDIICSLEPGIADTYMTDHSCLAQYLSTETDLKGTQQKRVTALHRPLLVICDTVSAIHALKSDLKYSTLLAGNVQFISQP